MADYLTTDTELTSVANAIRTKGGTSASLVYPTGFVSAIQNLPSGGTDVSDTTAVEADVRAGKYFHKADGSKVQGSIADQAAQTIHPSTTDQTIASGKYLTGTQTVKGVLLTNLDAGNIKKDVVVKVGDSTDDDCVTSVTGTYEGSGGGTEADWNDVIFYDYDGKRLYSYSAADFANLSAMPANPTHDGLTAQGWNWTLADAKTFVSTYGVLDIGQMYTTSDGKTRLYLDISSKNVLKVRINWKQTVTRGVTVNFGDGTSTTTVAGTGNVNIEHTYNSTGLYIVTFNVTSGTMTVKSPYYPTNYGKTSQTYLKAVEIGNNVTELDVLQNNNKLKYITIPNSVTTLPASNFCDNAWSLEHITLPNSVTTIGASIFPYCYSLKSASMPKQVVASGAIFNYCQLLNRVAIDFTNTTTNAISQYSYTARDVVIPSGVTTISPSAFSYNQRVSVFVIPSSVTTISTSAFAYSNGATEFHFKSSTPPTLVNTNAFTGTSSASVFYVPSASLDAYKTANNWSTYASRMVGE